MPPALSPDLRVAIVGAGFGGLAAAIELKGAGFDRLTIFERGESVGGVWRANTYPGAACDVPSSIYSFSFALKPDWSAVFGTQPEIREYLEQVTTEFDLRRHLRLGAEVTAATFDDATTTWTVELADGTEEEFDAVVMATGQLSRPKLPAVPGIDSFAGPSFHSAEWDHDVDLTDKDVIVVGSGASAIQIVPAIADQVRSMTVVQRSPNWVIRKSKRAHGPVERAILGIPQVRTLHHHLMFYAYEVRQPVIKRSAWPVRRTAETIARLHIQRTLKDRRAARAATPDYTMLCNRLLLSNDWYPTLARDHVELVGSGVQEVVEDGVITADGRHVQGDVIVWCTGFAASEFLSPITVVGRDGTKLAEQWQDGATAYLGLAMPRFPNFFMMFGPNTNSITNSIVYLLEKQARYLRQALVHAATAGGPVDLRDEVLREFEAWRDERMGETVFTDGCPGWYTNEQGKVTAMWPTTHLEYARMTRRFRPEQYDVVRSGDR